MPTSNNLSSLSCKSEGKIGDGSSNTKKIRIKRSIVLNPSPDFLVKKQLNRSVSISYNLKDIYNYYKDFNPALNKLSILIEKHDNKKNKSKCFKHWKEGQK